MTTQSRLVLSLTTVALLSAVDALAQATVRAQLDSQSVQVDEPVVLSIEIDGFTDCAAPTIPDIPGCTVRSLGVTSEGLVVSGRTRSQSRTYGFQITPTRVGRFEVPALTLRVDGRDVVTRPLAFKVSPSDVEELLAVEITCDEPRIYVGQRVRLKMTIWLKPATAGGRALDGRFMFQFIMQEGFGPFPLPQRVEERLRRAADGTSSMYLTYDTEADYVPNRAGPLSVDDVAITVTYPTRFGRDVFGDLRITGSRRVIGRPKVAAIDVLPLPTEGRPANFNNAVGVYDISVNATPTTVRVGDPIELTIELRGDGDLTTLPPPLLTANAALTAAFRVPTETLAGETHDGRRRYRQTIRAARADVTEIPPIEFAFFDPRRGEYRVARSPAIPINVEASEKLDAGALAGIATPEERDRAIELAPLDGLRGNETEVQALLLSSAPPSTTQVLVAVLAPPTAFLIGWSLHGLALLRGSDPGRRRRQNATRTALRRLADAARLTPRERAAEISAALAAYLADRTNEPPARFVGHSAVAFLRDRGAPDSTWGRWDTLLNRCAAASFGAGGEDLNDDSLAAEARACIDLTERLRL